MYQQVIGKYFEQLCFNKTNVGWRYHSVRIILCIPCLNYDVHKDVWIEIKDKLAKVKPCYFHTHRSLQISR